MVGFPIRVLALSGCVLALLTVVPIKAEPLFVRVYGRTYKIDPRSPSDEPKGPKPQEAMKALPSDIARGPGFRPSHEQVLGEIEERIWIARNQLDDRQEKMPASREPRNTGDAKAGEQEITGSLATGAAQTPAPELQHSTTATGPWTSSGGSCGDRWTCQ